MPVSLQVYVRHGCHICDDMLQALAPWREKYAFTLDIIDISGDAQLEVRYGTRVPVLCCGEQELCFYFLDEEAVDNYFSHL